jgi:signal transduction histidine kinase
MKTILLFRENFLLVFRYFMFCDNALFLGETGMRRNTHDVTPEKVLISVAPQKNIIGICLLLLASIALSGRAQHLADDRHYPDSLQSLLQNHQADTARADLLFLLTDYWSVRDTAAAFRYAAQALPLCKGNSFYQGLYHFNLAGIYFDIDADLSQQEYLLAEKLFQRYDTQRAFFYRARLWNNYGVLEQRKDDDKAYADILMNKAIPLAERSGDSTLIGTNLMNVGLIFMNYKEYDKALDYYHRAINTLTSAGKADAGLADCYIQAAKTYIFNDDYQAAKPCLDSAAFILFPHPESSYLPAYYQVEGMYYSGLEHWQAAINSFEKGIVLANRLQMPYDAISILFQQYKAYYAQKNYTAAKEVLLKVNERQETMPLIKNKMTILYELAQVEERLGNPAAAYGWLRQYTAVADSFFIAKTKSDVAALEAKYQSEKKEKEISFLEEKAKQQELILERNQIFKYLLISGVLILLLLLLIGFMLYRSKMLKMKEQAKAHEQKLREMEQAQQLRIYNAMLEGQEIERSRVAKDLHDGLGGMLAGIKLKLSSIAGKEQQQKSDMELYKVITQLDQSVNELRRIARNMMPETLLQFGLEPALKDLCSSLQTNELNIEFQAYSLGTHILQNEQIMIFRVIQELLSNAIRHADATNILLQCSQNGNMFFITVEDDGKGFNPDAPGNKKGTGLSNIQNRVEFLKGKLDIHSAPGEGTIVNIEALVNESG